MSRNPIRYTSRDFTNVMSDFNSDTELVNKPDWFKRMIAGDIDVNARYIDAAANQAYIRSIFSRKYMERRTETLGYTMSPHTTSSSEITFNIDPDNLPGGAIPKSDLVALWQDGGDSLQFESRTDETFSAVVESSISFDNGTDLFTVAGTYKTGDLIRITGGSPPSGFALSTNYYVIYVSATTLRLATSVDNAFAGIYINGASSGSGLQFTNYALRVAVYQQKTIDQYFIGTPTTDIWQEFVLNDEDVLHETVVIEINSINWTKVDTWVDSISTDLHYRVRQREEGEYIEFGDGESFGKIPDADIYVTYATGGGIASNVSGLNTVNKYLGNSSSILNVTNPSTFSGGSDRESLEKARRLSVISIGQNDLFLEDEYSVNLILRYGGVTHASIDHNYYGVLTSRVVIVPTGGGTSTAQFKSDLKDYLESRSFGIVVTVIDATETAFNMTTSIKVTSGATFATVKSYYELMVKLATYSTGLEILDEYESYGIASAVTLINSTFTLSFAESDYNEIESILINLIDKQFYATIDKTWYESDFIGVAEDITGIDFLIISIPGFPYTTAGTDGIVTIGTLTTLEIV